MANFKKIMTGEEIDINSNHEYDITLVYKAYSALEPQLSYDQTTLLQSVDKEHVLTLIKENLKEEDYDM